MRLNLKTKADVEQHAQQLSKLSNRLLVEKMIDNVALELLVGVICDPDFAQVLVVGAGGTQVELLQDTVQLLLPVKRQDIESALLSLRIGRLFTGFRGGAAADLTAAIDAIESIACYAYANRQRLIELDVNPLNGAIQWPKRFTYIEFGCTSSGRRCRRCSDPGLPVLNL